MKVLIVNHSPTCRYELMEVLVDRNYQFFQAATGQRAIESAISNRPHIILMDAQMPDMDSIECLRTIKEDAANERTRIIMLGTNLSRNNVRLDLTRRAHRLGCSDFVKIPLQGNELLMKIEKLERIVEISRASQLTTNAMARISLNSNLVP